MLNVMHSTNGDIVFKRSKIILTCGFLVFFSGNVIALDLEEGTIELEGGLDINYSSSDSEISPGTKSDDDSMKLDATALYYIRDNLGIGLLVYRNRTESKSGQSESTFTTYSYGPKIVFNRSLSSDVSSYFGVSYVKLSHKAEHSLSSNEISGSSWGVETGIKYFLSDNTSLNTGVNYFSSTHEYSNYDVKAKGISVGIAISVFL